MGCRTDDIAIAAVFLGVMACSSNHCGSPDRGEDSAKPPLDSRVATTCAQPEEVELTYGQASGYERCHDGSINRVIEVPIDISHYVERVTECPEDLHPHDGDCLEDSDCGEGSQHQCKYESTNYGHGCYCQFLCSTDDECGPGFVCVAPEAAEGTTVPKCVPAECSNSDDCELGECGVASIASQCEAFIRLTCRTDDDSCRTNDDCGDGQEDLCTRIHDEGRWACVERYGCD